MGFSGMHPSSPDQGSRAPQSAFKEFGRPRAWRVIHACEYVRDVLPVVEGQVAAGMRPYIVTPAGEGSAELYLSGRGQDQPRSLSLLRSWQDVRNWRKSLLDCAPETAADIVHAHSFSAGMAAVRNIGGVVYDLHECIEELAISAGQCEAGSWMGRSFRVAEQFVLARAAAVIVHSLGMQQAAQERGALSESIFVIPEPLSLEQHFPLPDSAAPDFLQQCFGLSSDAVTFLFPEFATPGAVELQAGQIMLLESMALTSPENPQFCFLLQGAETEHLRDSISRCASRLGIREKVFLMAPGDCAAAWQKADVIIAGGEPPPHSGTARRPNDICLRALAHGKTLLAADIPRNRDVSPDGQGCLWYDHGSPRDLAFRLAFLGRNPVFRMALAASGRAHLVETRNSTAIGEKYHDAYRYAFGRKRFTGPGTGIPALQPAANWS
ncbi:MAG TPA: glycosyltransferase [Candidatus Angelobacter sp.]|nr:glycosyltransferase [Candidatus Angelobacter sp.]